MAAVYQIEGLTKIYKGSSKRANAEISLSIQEGEIFGLLGPNGAGKSTLVNQMAGLVRPTSGSIRLFGMDVVKSPQLIPDYVALQAQNTLALKDLYPGEALLYTAQLQGMSAADARARIKALMQELGIDTFGKKRIALLSGGQQKLVSLAVTFVGNRPVQIFDEPTNNLDPQVRRMVWDTLLSLNKEGKTIIVVTHNVIEAERVLQRVGIINAGQLLAIGTPGTLKMRVDQRVRLELLFKRDEEGYDELLSSLGELHALTRQQRVVLCPRELLQEAITHILAQIGLDQLDDFRILTPLLEDVYLQLGGGAALG
ncbi:MAG: ABC transporter ATP-binding protein [Ktedonobacteraceae bacterium]